MNIHDRDEREGWWRRRVCAGCGADFIETAADRDDGGCWCVTCEQDYCNECWQGFALSGASACRQCETASKERSK